MKCLAIQIEDKDETSTSTTIYQLWFTDMANGNTVALMGTGSERARLLATGVPCKGVGGPEVINPDLGTMIGIPDRHNSQSNGASRLLQWAGVRQHGHLRRQELAADREISSAVSARLL